MAARKSSIESRVKFSNPEKIYFPEADYTKGEMVKYYLDVAPYILPHLKNRPVTLIRFPEGIRGQSFYEKNAPKFTPDWVKTFPVPRHRDEGVINYILINSAETLAWCANLGAIEIHPFLHRVPHLDRPTHVAFDLDPGEGSNLLTCIEVAFLIKDVLDQLGLKSFPKVSGSKGLQLYVPLNTPTTYEVTQPFAKAITELLEQRYPKLIVSKMSKVLRKGKVMIDWSQNHISKTTVAVYSLRAKREAPFVSMPVDWKELKTAAARKKIEGLNFSPTDALKRLKKVGDLFEPVLRLKQKIPRDFAKAASTQKPSSNSLSRYSAKRDFAQTKEPGPVVPKKNAGKDLRFVIQKHAATRLHYDFRLEMDGVLKSWAVPKGLPYVKGERHAGFEVEDHPINYLSFEGTIPKGQYGGGTVMVWDIGTYRLVDGTYPTGKLRVELSGKKLKGEWELVRIRTEDEDKPVWLIFKTGDPMKPLGPRVADRSAITRRTMEKIAEDNDAQWQSRPRGAE